MRGRRATIRSGEPKLTVNKSEVSAAQHVTAFSTQSAFLANDPQKRIV